MASGRPPSYDYRIENSHTAQTARGSLLPPAPAPRLYADYSLAVAVAVKSVADPSRQEVRVVHVPSGEVVFRTTGAGQAF